MSNPTKAAFLLAVLSGVLISLLLVGLLTPTEFSGCFIATVLGTGLFAMYRISE